MKQSVRDAFIDFSARFEGVVPWPYLDVRGLVTVGIGNLADPVELALGMPFLHPTGTPASRDAIITAWRTVKARTELSKLGGGSAAFRDLTSLRLSAGGIQDVVWHKLSENEAKLRARFPAYDSWPADAQLGLHSMAWAAGAAFHFPLFEAAALKRNFATCALQCHMDDTQNPGLRPRNAANDMLFTNAATIERLGLDPDTLYWPSRVTATGETEPGDPPPEGTAA